MMTTPTTFLCEEFSDDAALPEAVEVSSLPSMIGQFCRCRDPATCEAGHPLKRQRFLQSAQAWRGPHRAVQQIVAQAGQEVFAYHLDLDDELPDWFVARYGLTQDGA